MVMVISQMPILLSLLALTKVLPSTLTSSVVTAPVERETNKSIIIMLTKGGLVSDQRLSLHWFLIKGKSEDWSLVKGHQQLGAYYTKTQFSI